MGSMNGSYILESYFNGWRRTHTLRAEVVKVGKGRREIVRASANCKIYNVKTYDYDPATNRDSESSGDEELSSGRKIFIDSANSFNREGSHRMVGLTRIGRGERFTG